jgi:cellulose synthase (UDP-forming)
MTKHTKTERIHNTALLFIILAPLAIIYYGLYVFSPQNSGNIWLYLFQIFADGIAILNISALWLTILLDLIQSDHNKRTILYHPNWIKKPIKKIDVLIPATNEPIDIIENTLKHAVDMEYSHRVFILNDGNSEEVKDLAKRYKVTYIQRAPHERTYAKSGNLNHGLKFSDAEFFAVFDSDHVPKKTFLTELLPLFENERVALVQTPQHYTNTDNFIASGTAQAQEIFYKYVQPAKNSYNSSFCVGTNMIYRRSAIDSIGGIALRDHSEDVWTTIQLHEKGYESVFYNKVLAEGRAPSTIQSFFRQQTRWARGGFSLFFTHNPLFQSSLTLDQRLQYFFSNIHYFTCFSIVIYLLMPIMYLLLNIHPMDVIHSHDWIYHYFPYFIIVYFLPLLLLRSFRLSTISTSIASFAPYLKAFFSIIFKNRYTWIPTEIRSKKTPLIMSDIWPHMLLIFLSVFSLFVGWYNVYDFPTTAICSIWTLVNSFYLVIFITKGLQASPV